MEIVKLSDIDTDVRKVILEIIATDGPRERKVVEIAKILRKSGVRLVKRRYVDYLLRPIDENAARLFHNMFQVHGESELALFCEERPELCELVLL